MFAATRSRGGGLALLVALLCACATAPAWGAVPGGYAVQAVDGPAPSAERAFGSVSAAVGDLDQDGVNDLAIGDPTANGGDGEVVAVSGADGSTIYRVQGPIDSALGNKVGFGSAVAPLGDILLCAGSAGGDCSSKLMSGDGSPEFLVGAPGADVSDGVGADQGRVYVIDGQTGAIANRVMLAGDDLPVNGKAEFGYSLLSPGDMDGDSRPDLLVGAPGYSEADPSPNCEGAVCAQAGRVYVYWAADLGGHATSPLQQPRDVISNPFAQADPSLAEPNAERFGHSLSPLADIGRCANQSGGQRTCLNAAGPDNVPSAVPDGRTEFLVSMPLYDQGATVDAGAALVMDGATALVIRKIDAEDAQAAGHFSSFSYRPPAPPNMGGTAHSDIVIGAPDHGMGRAYVIDGDLPAGSTLVGLPDPAPIAGGRFGAAAAGLGSGGVAVGAAFGPRVGTVRIFTPGGGGVLAQTICDPDGQSEARFGASVTSLDDANGDGFDELAIGAPGFDRPGVVNAGRVYILTSKGPGATGPPGQCVPFGAGSTGGGVGAGGGGGGAKATPPKRGTAVTARVLRRLVMKPNRKRVRKSAFFRLRGTLTASANRSVCQRRQKIALQRRKTSGGRFQTFEVAVTRSTGKFTARAIAERTYLYRARVSQTARCMGAVSKPAKVSILRKRGSR